MKKLYPILCVLLILSGSTVLLYPAISNYINEKNASYALQQISEHLENQSQEALAQQRAMAESYNDALKSQGGIAGCKYNYREILNFGNEIMGSLVIPCIDLRLPIYHGTDSAVLAKGVGHMECSAFPIGGKGNHSVLTGHTGLPEALLFTRLTEMSIGDTFYIEILGQTVHYRVDSIVTVLPYQTEMLAAIADSDYCTLITCTPYGVNSHRLLVRGCRLDQ